MACSSYETQSRWPAGHPWDDDVWTIVSGWSQLDKHTKSCLQMWSIFQYCMDQPYPEQTGWSFSKLSVILVVLPETKWASKPKLCYGNLLELCLNSGNISTPWKEPFICQWHCTFYTDVLAWIVIEMCPASLLGSFFEASTTLSAAHWTHGSKRVAQKCSTKHSLNLTWHDKSCLHFFIDCLIIDCDTFTPDIL